MDLEEHRLSTLGQRQASRQIIQLFEETAMFSYLLLPIQSPSSTAGWSPVPVGSPAKVAPLKQPYSQLAGCASIACGRCLVTYLALLF